MKKETIKEILEILATTYHDAGPLLKFNSPFELLISVILSAQCTDVRVNKTTAVLFPVANTPASILALGQECLEEYIRNCGLFHNKAKNILATCERLEQVYGGQVPDDYDALLSLPGVGRKTANVVYSIAFHHPALAVDTHVFRVAHRLQLADGKTPLIVEKQLQKIVPKKDWSQAHHWFIWHGRRICTARSPHCKICPLTHLCPTSTENGKV